MYRELKTDRLLLRPSRADDLDAVHAYASDPDNTRFMLFLPNGAREETARFLSAAAAEWEKPHPQCYEFVLTLDDGTLIGAASIALAGAEGTGELGWILNRQYWKRGYAKEAALALIAFAREELGLTRLVAHCDARNQASARVMEAIGLTLEDDAGHRLYPKTGEEARELTYSLTLR